jgi:hypothetical protein
MAMAKAKAKAKAKPKAKAKAKPKAKPKSKSRGTTSIAAFAAAPGFAVVGDGNWIPPGDRFVCYVLLASAPTDDKQRTAILTGVPRLLRHAIAWSGRLLQIGTYVKDAYLDNRKAATLVRKQYKAGKPAKLSRASKRELAGDDYDPKVLPAAMEAMADFGNQAPWARFYADLHAWLVRVHAKHPIELVIRPALDGQLTPLHHAGVEQLFTLALGELADAAAGEDWVCDFLKEVVLRTSRAKLDETRAGKLLPILRHTFGTGQYGEAGRRVLFALAEAARARFFDELPADEVLSVFLSTDYVAELGKLPRASEQVSAAFDRFWRAAPTAEAIDSMAYRIEYALHPAGDHPALCEVIVDELVRHRADYPRERIADTPRSLELRGHTKAANRLRAALEQP